MLVTLLPIDTLVRPLQFRKALLPMLVTLFGIVMLERLVQLSKIPFTAPNVKPSSKITFFKSGILAKVWFVLSKVHPLPIVNEVMPLVF